MNKQQVVLITGTSNGFGYLTARELAAKGNKVYAGMRNTKESNKDRCEELSAIENITVCDLDVTNVISLDSTVDKIVAKEGHIDVLINNAGSAGIGLSELHTNGEMERMFEVNVFGVYNLTNKVIPVMRNQKSGLIINVSSILGRLYFPAWSTYSASKAALEAMAECWRYELNGVGIDSVIIEPGLYPTTNIFNRTKEFSPAVTNDAIMSQYSMVIGMLQDFEANRLMQIEQGIAPNPVEIANTIVDLINTPFGQRPLRTVLDKNLKPLVDNLNAETDKVHSFIFSK